MTPKNAVADPSFPKFKTSAATHNAQKDGFYKIDNKSVKN
jgi:hypothetical protein